MGHQSVIIIFAFLVSLFVGLEVFGFAEANWVLPPSKPTSDPSPPAITVYSPVNGSVHKEDFDLDFYLSSPLWARGPGKPTGNIIGLTYKIDDRSEKSISIPDPYGYRPDEYERTVPISISSLDDGPHTLSIISYCEKYYVPENSSTYSIETYDFSAVCAIVNFDVAVNPQIKIISPENLTYQISDVFANFTVDRATSWIGYSLNGQVNVTTKGHLIFTNLNDGSYSLVFYANDTEGNMGKSTTCFSVNTKPILTSTITPAQIPISKDQPTATPTKTEKPISTPVEIGIKTENPPFLMIVVAISILVVFLAPVYIKKKRG